MQGMGKLFGEHLKRHREALGVTGYKICQVSGMASSLFTDIEKGRRSPSQANLETLAGVPDLVLSMNQLKAWAALDEIGTEGMDLIKEHAPEAISNPPVPGLSRKEMKLLDAIRELADGDLDSVDLGATSYVWALEPAARLRHLIAAVQDLGGEEDGRNAASK